MKGTDWTREDIARLVKAYEDRVPPADIALEMGRTEIAVIAKARRLGLGPS